MANKKSNVNVPLGVAIKNSIFTKIASKGSGFLTITLAVANKELLTITAKDSNGKLTLDGYKVDEAKLKEFLSWVSNERKKLKESNELDSSATSLAKSLLESVRLS